MQRSCQPRENTTTTAPTTLRERGSRQKIMPTIRDLITPSADSAALAKLERLYSQSGPPPSAEERERAFKQAAQDLAGLETDPLELIRKHNDYCHIRPTLLDKWREISFQTRMMLRDMMVEIERSEAIFKRMPRPDQEELLAALDERTRTLFVFSRRLNLEMASDIRSKVQNDSEISSQPSSQAVWETVKRLDPGMEEARQKPLDPSKYVKRDTERTPRRSA